MNWLLIAPILLPLATACVQISLWRFIALQRWISVASGALQLIVAVMLLVTITGHGVQATTMGGWPAPYGITLVADVLAGIMVILSALKGFAVAVYSITNIDPAREAYGYHPMLQILLMGVSGAFLTGDMFNLYVCFEIMLMSSFVLLSLGGERGQIEGAIKYVTLNLISSAIFLAGVGILYGITGTLNMADLAVKLDEVDNAAMLTIPAMMFLVAFGVKAAIFPLFFWLPASYHTPPVAVSAIFAGLLTKVGVYAMFRVFTLIFHHDMAYTHTIILVLSGLTMLTGVLGAAAQNDFRRILSFHIISQIGYMIMGLGLMALLLPGADDATRVAVHLAVAASVFYIAHHIVVKTNLFLISGVVERLQGTGNLKYLGGFYRRWPMLAGLFLIPSMSLAGIPPLSGFWAKFSLIKAGLQLESYLIVGVALFVGLLTLYSMVKIWAAVFWATEPADSRMATGDPLYREAQRGLGYKFTPIVLLAVITICIGLYPAPLFDLAMQAADQLLDRTEYIEAVAPDSLGAAASGAPVDPGGSLP